VDWNCSSEIESRAIKRLCELTGHSSPFDAVIARSRMLLAEHGQFVPPFDPEQIARLQKITQIDRVDITFDACLTPTVDGFKVQVCKYHSRGRQNFSIAHEIGHTFLIELEPALGGARREMGLSASSTVNSDFVEKLCDTAAAELIWPTHVFQRDAWDAGPSLQAVIFLAGQYKASITATARRFAEVGPWRCGFIFWERQAPQGTNAKLHPKLTYRSSCASLISRNKMVADDGSQFYRALDRDDIVKGWEALSLGGRHFYTESIKLGEEVMSMVILEPHAEILAAKRQESKQRSLFR
jgi:Zn-dependent peptidase ImmA (M78 family)